MTECAYDLDGYGVKFIFGKKINLLFQFCVVILWGICNPRLNSTGAYVYDDLYEC